MKDYPTVAQIKETLENRKNEVDEWPKYVMNRVFYTYKDIYRWANLKEAPLDYRYSWIWEKDV